MEKKVMEKQIDPPEEFICPLTKELMRDPVVSRYGDSFERIAILEWLGEGNSYCPVTGNPLRLSCLVSNKQLAWKIRCWLHEHGMESPSDNDDDGDGEFDATKNTAAVIAVPPDRMICALTKQVMHDPVTSILGHNFERNAILKYLEENDDTCPVTGKKLLLHQLIPNLSLKFEIHEWLEKNADHGEELPELSPKDTPLDEPQHSPHRAATVGIRGDHGVEHMRAEHWAKLKLMGLEDNEDENEVEDPFSLTTQIDSVHHTPRDLAHVF